MPEPINPHDIRQLISGDKLVFSRIYDFYSRRVYTMAFRFLKDKEQSEEIVQETFIKLWLNREKLDPNGNIWLYLYVVAKRLSLNALREISKSDILTKNLLNHIEENCLYVEENVITDDLENYMNKAIEMLSPRQRLIFKLSRDEGLKHKEIADKLRISPNTVKNHMVAAIKTLKVNLKKSDFIYTISLIIIKYFF